MEQIAQKICIYQIKVIPLQMFSYLNWIYGDVDTPRSDCAGCFVVYLDKKIVNFTKNQLFFEKIVEKICTCQKKAVPLHRLTNKQLQQ